jgi:hypothetical protein
MFVGAFDPRLKIIVASCGWTQFEYYAKGSKMGKRLTKEYGGRLGAWAQQRYMPLMRTKYHLNGKEIPFDFNGVIDLLAPRTFFSNSALHDHNFNVEGVRKGIAKASKVYRFLDAANKLQVRYPKSNHDFPPKVRREAYEYIDQALDHVPNKEEIK